MNCKDCSYYFPIIVGVNGKTMNGECRCHPPQIMVVNNKMKNIYPIVGMFTSSCSEFDLKDRVVLK